MPFEILLIVDTVLFSFSSLFMLVNALFGAGAWQLGALMVHGLPLTISAEGDSMGCLPAMWLR